MRRCYRISWEGLDVGSTVADSLLPLSVTVVFVFSFAKSPFVSPNIDIKHLWSRVLHDKLGVAQQVTFN
jgi:Na+/H+ antiporter NhaC